MGLFEDLPDATDAGGKKVEGTSAKTPGKDGSAVAAAGGWSGAGSKLRAPTRRPPTSLPSAHALKAQAAALRAQQAKKRASLASNAEADAEASGEDDRGASLATADDAAEDDKAKHAGTWGTMSAAIEDEYVPSRPNSYEALAKTRAETRAREEIETAREARRLVLEGQRAARAALRRAVSGGTGGLYSGRDRRELDVTGEEAFARRATLGAHGARVGDGTSESSGTEGADRSAAASGGGGESLAMKMMKKMGYVEGRGLGKNDQGMTTPLEVRKDSARSGIIVNAPEKPHEGA
jgi:splicing factor 45|mmetsp:Transcript_14762/g.62310  ORF Transcript_14762/g.62310 Transcript_14762/m.62310 type:complete len:294 (-) Transcript_14762:279-1160(-)